MLNTLQKDTPTGCQRVLVWLAAILLMAFAAGIGSAQTMEDEKLYRAVVLEVDTITADPPDVPYSSQWTQLQMKDGPYAGAVVESINVLTDNPYYDLVLEPRMQILVHVDESGPEPTFHAAEFVRDRTMYWLAALFAVLMILVGGFKGLKAMVSLIVMALLVVYVMLPLLFAGYNPLWITISVTAVGALIFLFLVSGAGRKTLGAAAGTITGLLLAGILASAAGRASHLTGLSSTEAQILQYLGPGIDFRGLLFSGMILGALGAALDVGMSIASAMEQIHRTSPGIRQSRLIQAGFQVGRDVLGTMANTLILAYVGASLPLLLLFFWQEASAVQLLNMDLIATEVVRALAGSIGLTLAVPATAVFTGLLLTGRGRTRRSRRRRSPADLPETGKH